MSDEQIIIPAPNDLKYGYLSNDSKYGFFEDDVYWPTVTHYVEAKKFEGTQYEAEIRSAKTALQAKRKTKERDTIIFFNNAQKPNGIRRERHNRADNEDEENNNNNENSSEEEVEFDSASSYIFQERACGLKKLGFKPRKNWLTERNKYLTTAITLKFKQNKRLLQSLIATYPLEIVSSDRQLQIILTDLRETEINKLGMDNIQFNQNSKEPSKSNETKNQYELFPYKKNIKKTDVWTSVWHNEDIPDLLKDHRCQLIRNTLILMAVHISDMECCDKIYPEMIFDAIYNLFIDSYLLSDEENGSIDKCGIIEKLQNFPNISKQNFPNFYIYANNSRLLFLRIINSWNEKAPYKIRQNRVNKSKNKNGKNVSGATRNWENSSNENQEINEASANVTKFIAFCNFNKTLNSVYNRCKVYFSGGKIISSSFNAIVVPYSKRSYRKGVPVRFRRACSKRNFEEISSKKKIVKNIEKLHFQEK